MSNIPYGGFGVKPPKKDLRDYTFDYPVAGSTYEETGIPDSYELLNLPAVKDQGNVNSCVAHVAASIEEYFNIRDSQEHMSPRLSCGYIYGCRYNYRGEGMYLRDALKTLKNRGICDYREFPYDDEEVPTVIDCFEKKASFVTDKNNTISSYFNISTSSKNMQNNIKKAILSYGPVMASIKYYDDMWVNDSNGKMRSYYASLPERKDNYECHCVMIYGWNEDGWLIRNSWGKEWGKDGNAIYPYEYDIVEAWGISDFLYCATDDTCIKKKNYNKFESNLIKILNFIINLLEKIKGEV